MSVPSHQGTEKASLGAVGSYTAARSAEVF